MKISKRFAALAVVGGLLFGGTVAAPLVAPPSASNTAHADTLVRTYKVKTSAQCYTEFKVYVRSWCVSFYPGGQSNCQYERKRALCGGKF